MTTRQPDTQNSWLFRSDLVNTQLHSMKEAVIRIQPIIFVLYGRMTNLNTVSRLFMILFVTTKVVDGLLLYVCPILTSLDNIQTVYIVVGKFFVYLKFRQSISLSLCLRSRQFVC